MFNEIKNAMYFFRDREIVVGKRHAFHATEWHFRVYIKISIIYQELKF